MKKQYEQKNFWVNSMDVKEKQPAFNCLLELLSSGLWCVAMFSTES